MLWDPSFESWIHYDIRRNSDVWLIDQQGNRIGERFFALDTDYIFEQLPDLRS